MDELLSLSDADQEALLNRLTVHALCKMRRLTWRGAFISKGGTVPGGFEPYDFALDAIEKLLDGRRPWNREKYASLEAALRATIDSDISHLVESIDNAQFRRIIRSGSNGETDQAYEVSGTEPNPLRMVIASEWRENFHKAAMKELKDDEFLQKLFQCVDADITDPAEISIMLDVTVDEVNNGKKRLRRKLEKLDGKFLPPKGKAKP